jgi:2-polyprenyl-3-methyl-5-hydroxy-6-metoxy-1,4-benzoquinol methylase
MKPTIADYWRDAALEWDESSYAGRLRALPLVERVATLLRGHIRERSATAERRLDGWIEGKSFLEIGMGGGELLVHLLQRGASRATGIDVSPLVVDVARKRAEEAGVAERADLRPSTIHDLSDPVEPDLLVGLGIIEYLTPDEFRALLDRIRPREVFVSFDEKQYTFKKGLHAVYRRLRKLPYYKKYRQQELRDLLAASGHPNARVFREGANSFVTTLV